MKFDKFNFKFLKSWGILVFTLLVVLRVALWLSMEWPPNNDIHLNPGNAVVKIHNLPIRFMVYWPDTACYWPSSPKTFGESLSLLLHDHNKWAHLQHLFYLPIRVVTDNIAYGVLAQNILGLISAWMLFVMLRPQGAAFAAIIVLISFVNLFTISMEYALLREVLTRFLLLSLLYLLWRMAISPSWRLAIAAGGTLFLLPWSRPELMIIVVTIIPVALWCLPRKYAMVIIIIGLLGTYAFKEIGGEESTRSGKYFYPHHNLLVGSYNYDSPDLKDLPKRIYAKAMLCKELYGVEPHWPSFRYQGFEAMRNEVIGEWKRENGIDAREEYFDILFLDILKHNTKYVVYSAAYSFWSYMTGNLGTVSPLIYAGDNPNYTSAWPYYYSPSLTSFGDPLSELSPKERGPKWLTAIMAPFSEYWLRKICAPFFFIGLFCIGRMFFLRRETVSTASMLFWLLAASWSFTLLLIMSFIGMRCSRFIFSVDPFLFATSVLGMQATGRMLLEYWSIGVYSWFELQQSSIKFAIVGTVILMLLVGVFVLKNKKSPASNAYAVWNMDADKWWYTYLQNLMTGDKVPEAKDKLADSRGGYSATSFNTEIVEGHSGKARYFNGKDSYIQTPVNVQGWKGLTISLWVKPERKEGDELSVILDNGHSAGSDFVIQSADSSGEKWVWHCNGIDIFFDLPLDKWTQVVVIADGEKGIVRAYTSGSQVTEVRTDEGFEFGPTPLTIGKLAKADARYFKGSIDRVVIWGTAIEK